MKAKFYLKDVEVDTDQKGGKKVVKDVLHFSMSRPGHGGPHAPDVEYDNKATEDHKKNYSDAYSEFEKEQALHKKGVVPSEIKAVHHKKDK